MASIARVQSTQAPKLSFPVIHIYASDILGDNTNSLHLEAIDFLNHASNEVGGIPSKLVDVGINFNFQSEFSFWLNHGDTFISKKVAFGSQNLFRPPSLSTNQCIDAMKVGGSMIISAKAQGVDCIGVSSLDENFQDNFAAILITLLDLGEDSYHEDLGFSKKSWKRLHRIVKSHPKTHDPYTIMAIYGTLDLAAMVGSILKACEEKILVLLDSFKSIIALLLAKEICAESPNYCVVCNVEPFALNSQIIDNLRIEPLLNLGFKKPRGKGIEQAYLTLSETMGKL